MDDIGKGLTAQIDELIDNHLSIVQADSKQKQFYSLLKGHTADFEFVSDQIASMVKSGSYINSMFLLNNKGLVVAGITKKGDSMVDVDLSKRAYWKDVSQGKEVIENTISKGAATGLMVFIIAVPIMDENNQLLGAVGLAINWSKFMEKFILPVRIGLHGHAYMFDSKGIMLAHPEQNLILSDLSRLDYVRTAIAQKNGSVRNTQDSEGKVEVFNTVSRTGWIVCLNDTEAELATVSIAKRNFLIAMGLVTYFVLLGLIMLLIRKVITSPLASIKSYAEKVAKGDYQALLSGEFHFELKELSEHVAKMTNELKNKLGFANGVLKGFATPITVYDINNRLTYTNKEMLNLLHLPGEPEQYFGQSPGEFFYADASKESIITKCLRDRKFIQGIEERMQFRDNLSYFIKIDVSQIYDLDGRLIGAITSLVDLTDMREQQHKIERQRDHLAEAAKEAEAVSARITATTLDLAAKIEQFSQGSRDQSNRVAQTTTDMDEMNSSVQQVAKNVDQVLQLSEGARQKAENGASVVQQVVQEISGIQKQALKLKTDMTTLGQQAQGIGQVLNVISDIADQTNLLALNAAIEAARAGEAGRGFAVVADEVRKLAEKTMSATREVGEAIQAIQTGTNMNVANVDMTVQKIDQANNLADQSGQALTQIVNMVDQTSDQVRPMAQASERQTAASERIYQSMEDISRISNETSVGLGHSATDVNDLANQFQVLKGLIEDMLLSEDGGNKVRALR